MNWLQKQQVCELHQTSDIPYLVTDKEIKLCFDNCFSSNPIPGETLSFKSASKKITEIEKNFYKFDKFPVSIPITHVINIAGIINNGKVMKTANSQENRKKIILVRSQYLEKLPYKSFNKFCEKLNNTKSFILIGNNIAPIIRAVDEISSIISHKNWYRTTMHILSETTRQRGINWTKTIPQLTIECYGLHDGDTVKIEHTMKYAGIENLDTIWVD